MDGLSNISSSISDTFSNSKNQIVTARDRMKEYSRVLSSRTSTQIRKKTQAHNNQEKNSQFTSPDSKRLFTSSIPTSTARKVDVEEKWTKLKSQWGENMNKNNIRNYMKSTAAFKNNVVESKFVRHVKKELKETDAKKIIVNMTAWKAKSEPEETVENSTAREQPKNPTPTSSASKRAVGATSGTISSLSRVADTVRTRRQKAFERETEMKRRPSYFSPPARDKAKSSAFSFLVSPLRSQQKSSKVTECIVFTEDSKDFLSPARSYGGLTTGSLSSFCTVESFLSPTKAGIVGCQNRYEPYLHKIRGPCELCVFRLSDSEKEKLDAQGRHLMVQFTTGGCRDCKAFPKDDGELPVRLCQKCFTNSHRHIQTRRRKKGSGSHIGYSFATVSEGEIR